MVLCELLSVYKKAINDADTTDHSSQYQGRRLQRFFIHALPPDCFTVRRTH